MSTNNEIPDILADGQTLDVGDVVKITITTKDDEDVLADPATLQVTIQPGGGTSRIYELGTDDELTRISTGIYQLLHPLEVAFFHYIRVVTTGEAGAEPGRFFVRKNPVSDAAA